MKFDAKITLYFQTHKALRISLTKYHKSFQPYRSKLTEDKIDTFIQMRINQLREEGATEDVDLAPALRFGSDYCLRHGCPTIYSIWFRQEYEFYAISYRLMNVITAVREL